MLEDLKVNHNWMVHTLQPEANSIFSEKQTSQLLQFFQRETVALIESIVHKQALSQERDGIIQLALPPVQFLIIKEAAKTAIGLSANENSPYVKKEKDGSTMETSFIARSPKMQEVIDIVKKVSYVDSTILLLGQSGVGKSVIAKLIHKYSGRSDKNFISVNCGAIPEPLMEAELFGYTHGSFTGGQRGGKKGIFETANGGTVFLDEIGELPYNLQVKLLEVLQENTIRPIGAAGHVPVDVRVIAATNQNLLEQVQQKKFRADLYYRLHVVPIEIPSLHERSEDIIPLSRYFLQKQMEKHGIFKTFHPDVEEVFTRYNWPGNVRELENIIERLFITTEDNEIQLKHLPAFLHQGERIQRAALFGDDIMPLKEAKRLLEEELIKKAYDLTKSTYKAAKILGVDQSTVAKKLKDLRTKEGNQP